MTTHPTTLSEAKRNYPIFKISAASLALGALAVMAYSIFIAVHEPDPQETVVLGQSQVAAGSPAGLRILVRNHASGAPIPGANVEVTLNSKTSGAFKLGSFRTDATGSFDGSLNVPDIAPGDYQWVIEVVSPAGWDRIVKKVEVLRPARLLLSTDKPIYQPGQTIHLRSLMLNARTEKPFTNETTTFEISDPNGNKVFKESHQSSAFGIASADFVLASELNLGRYQIRVLAGAATTGRAVEVKHYVLPKFKIHIVTDRPYYLPGQTVSGTIQAAYFFGKPVAGAAIKLTAATFQEKPVTIAELTGQTDAHGKHPFRFVLPDFFVGLPQKNAEAFLDLTAEVEDTAQHSEQTTLSLTVAQSDLEITAIPEAGSFVPGVENILYVLTAYPDGRPALCKVFANGTGYATDKEGTCEIKMTPADSNPPVEITALDSEGRKAKLTFQPDKGTIAPNLLLRADQAVYQAGRTARLTIHSPENDNTIFLDVIKDGQTVLTKSTALRNHRAQCSLNLPALLVGAITVNAYVITADGEDRGCSRVLYVNPASGLRIAAKLSKPVYRPGELAAIDFSVTDAQGRPAPAALGIAAVDESVFALQENRPGLLRQFLDVEGDLLKPRYQIKSFDAPDTILLGTRTSQNLVAAYLASLQPQHGGSGVDELLRSGDPNAQSLIDQVRRLEGTQEYDSLRNDPQFAEAFEFLEGGGRTYSLREDTGPVKLRAVKAQREAYANLLRKNFEAAFAAFCVLTPFCLLLFLGVRAVKSGKPGDLVIWFGVACLILILASMMLPALARAKQKAQRISLINTLKQIETEKRIMKSDATDSETTAQNPPRVRRDFPETLLWRPELITDDQGNAKLEIPLADSITTWRTSIDGVSAAGKMGSAELPIPVFQDFFVDLDLPVSMSLGDEISVPVACYNYLSEPQDIRLTLAAADWFQSPTQAVTIHLAPNEVKSASLPIKVLRVGDRSLRVTARGTKMSDAIEREISVLPVGEKIERTRNEVLQSEFADVVMIPNESIPDSQKLVAKFYPSRFSEIVEGLDSIFRAPYGCFEQTSSTTYPNVLALDYLKRVGRLTPEVEIKARKFINAGYQRLLTFEVPGGGFEWFGRDPANICLTAYGILEFTDMARVHPVDDAVIQRARAWLFAKQNGDGSWDEIHRGWTWEGRGSMTAFAAWALAESGDQSPNLDNALKYLRSHPAELSNTYAKALAANAFLARDRNDSFGRQLAAQLKEGALVDNEGSIHWTSTGYSITYSHGSGMDTECTALCAMALMKAGTSPQSVKQGLTWISRHKFADGTLGSTQATILAMRALLAGSTASLGQEFESVVTVQVNGHPVETFRLNKDNSDVMQQLDLTKFLRAGENRIQFRQTPSGELPFQLAGTYWMPGAAAAPINAEPLQIDVQYDHSRLAVEEQLNCAVTVKNNTSQRVNMAIVDLGIPPGFEVETAAFAAMRDRNQIAKFEVTGTQVILYLRELSDTVPFRFSYALRPKYPLRVQTPPSAVYEYYQPRNRAQTKPVTLEAS